MAEILMLNPKKDPSPGGTSWVIGCSPRTGREDDGLRSHQSTSAQLPRPAGLCSRFPAKPLDPIIEGAPLVGGVKALVTFCRKVVASLLLVVLPICSAPAQVYPSAPQSATSSDGVDAAGMIKVLSTAHGGVGGFLDVSGYTSCRYVTDGLPAGNDELIPIDSMTDWKAWLSDPGQGDSQTVCCRPQTVTLCQVGGATHQTFILPYTIYGQTQTPMANCTDEWGQPYKDSQPWKCGQAVGAAGLEDGQWSQPQADSYTCSPNAFTTGCSASCPQTVGTTTTYDSCGNVQAVNSCSISCCTNDYQKVGCSGSTATYEQFGTCPGGGFTVAGGCSLVSYTCGASCHPDADVLGPESDGCTYVYQDCNDQGDWGPPPGSSGCSETYESLSWTATGCQDNSLNGSGSNNLVVAYYNCTCSEWE